MIVVIADDLTGAAELAGLALRYNLSVEVVTDFPLPTQSDVLIIATDTRSQNEAVAIEEIKRTTEKAYSLQPVLFFKKIDSVLRGHVLAEVKAQLEVTGLKTALVVAANPALDRTIVDGHYYYKGQPVHLSSFSTDPEFPVKSSYVPQMLRADKTIVHLLKPNDDWPEEGVVIGEVKAAKDIEAWAGKKLDDVLLVGAAGFFTSLLEEQGYKRNLFDEVTSPFFQGPNLFVCGTSFRKSIEAIELLKKTKGTVSYMPTELLEEGNESALQNWCVEVIQHLQKAGNAVIAIDPDSVQEGLASALHLRQQMAAAVKCILRQIKITNVFIEGGSTASAILKETGINCLIPTNEIASGVTRLYAPQQALHIILKPGSYDWPEEVWALTSNNPFTPYEQSKLASG